MDFPPEPPGTPLNPSKKSKANRSQHCAQPLRKKNNDTNGWFHTLTLVINETHYILTLCQGKQGQEATAIIGPKWELSQNHRESNPTVERSIPKEEGCYQENKKTTDPIEDNLEASLGSCARSKSWNPYWVAPHLWSTSATT